MFAISCCNAPSNAGKNCIGCSSRLSAQVSPSRTTTDPARVPTHPHSSGHNLSDHRYSQSTDFRPGPTSVLQRPDSYNHASETTPHADSSALIIIASPSTNRELTSSSRNSRNCLIRSLSKSSAKAGMASCVAVGGATISSIASVM